jgi:hypothetical protein
MPAPPRAPHKPSEIGALLERREQLSVAGADNWGTMSAISKMHAVLRKATSRASPLGTGYTGQEIRDAIKAGRSDDRKLDAREKNLLSYYLTYRGNGMNESGTREFYKAYRELKLPRNPVTDREYVKRAPLEVVGRYATFSDLLDGLRTSAEKTYTAPGQVPATLRKLIITAANQAYTAETLKQVFDQVDNAEVVVRRLADAATGARLISIDYGAGDNTFGAVFDTAGVRLVAINDGDLMPVPAPA